MTSIRNRGSRGSGGASGGVFMDGGQIVWKFEIVPHGGIGSANPSYPEIEAAVDGTLDLSALPAVTIQGGEHLFAAYSATSKHSTVLPDGVGLVAGTCAATLVGTPDTAATVSGTIGDKELYAETSTSVDTSANWKAYLASEDVASLGFTSGAYGVPGSIGLTAVTSATTGSWLVTVTFTISGFITATPRDQLIA